MYLIISTLSGLKGRTSLLKILYLSLLHGSVYLILNEILPIQIQGIILLIISILISSLILELDFVLSILTTLISVLIILTVDLTVSMTTLGILNIPISDIVNNPSMRTLLTFIVQLTFLIIAFVIYMKNITLPKKYFINKKISLLISSIFFAVCIFAFLAFIIGTFVDDFQPIVYIALVIIFISFSLVMYKLNQYVVTMAVKEMQLEDQRIYIEYIKELMNHLKAQRHEFINHINVLYGLVQIKDVSRLETAKRYIETLNITIQGTSDIMATDEPVVSGLLVTKTAIAEQKNIEMDINITDRITDTPLSLTEVSTILNNLINNAIEFSETLPEKNRYICIEVYGDENNVYIDICNENNGQAITDTEIIFEKGFSTKPNQKDYRGFGLYNVKSIIEKHHGSIAVESDLHETSFKVSLPKKK
ncbi:sensor histidine kinase [Defluviitalea saccharophila]|uniref:GHKL domain-containing protein n=1 Tax=Defluviitalea saccharophila TaxID=879970 RepID=A0ABZ2Y799_9FIRM